MNTSSAAQAPSCAKHPTFVSTHALNIIEHYYHAREKHPYFSDGILSPVEDYEKALAFQRTTIAESARCNMVAACDLIECELLEAFVEIAKNNKNSAVEECYDAIAVLLRVIDVLEGRQPLGKPKEGASNGKSE